MNRFFPTFVEVPGAIGLLILRVITGIAIVLHSIPLLQHPTRWMNELHLPSPAPGGVQFLAAFGEFVCGLAIIVGIVTPIASLSLAIIMAGALFTVHLPRGDAFVGSPGEPSSELAVVYLAIMLLLLLVGPGTLSLDALFFRRKPSWL